MKTKRKNNLLALLASCLLCCWACSDGNDDGPDQPLGLMVSKEALAFKSGGGTETFTLTAGKNNWSIAVVGRLDGISVSPMSGAAGEATITVVATENTTEDLRSGSLVIRQEGNTDTVKVAIAQEGIIRDLSIKTDSLALVALYNSLNGKEWALPASGGKARSLIAREYPWDLTAPVSSWSGVEVSDVNGSPRVTALIIPVLDGLKGTVSPQIADLRELTAFDIQDASTITGDFPTEIYRWAKCIRLSVMKMVQMKWSISDRISEMSALKCMKLQGVEITVEDFGHLYGITSLDSLYINTAMLQGALPVGISALSNLKCLGLEGCASITALPEDLCNMSGLKELWLGACKKLKALPENIGSLGNLQKLYLSGSKITALPASFSELKALNFLHMSSMGMTGNADELFAGLTAMEEMEIGYNELTGSLEWLKGMKSLRVLDASDNNLKGTIRFKDMFTEKIERLMLATNEIEGTLEGIGTLTGIEILSLSECKLSGELLKELALIHPHNCFLENNNLTGTIPVEMKDFMREMTLPLNITGNRLSGIIPQEIVDAWLPLYGGYVCDQQAGYGFDNCISE